jgi:hypothetical protein
MNRSSGPDSAVILPTTSAAFAMLSASAARCKAVLFAGLPGVGKTLLLQQMTHIAHARGRKLYLLQWDIARQACETPDILARYPEVAGATHPAIRIAVGYWVRHALARWAGEHVGDDAILLGEAPLVGNRFIEIARRCNDDAERFLAASTTEFIIPAPTTQVRAEIAALRARDLERPRHVREAANAPPNLLDALMEELRTAGAALGVPGAEGGRGYDPDLYAAIYTRLLAHRHVRTLLIDACFPVVASAYELGTDVVELAPAATEVAAALACAESLGRAELDRRVLRWFDT